MFSKSNSLHFLFLLMSFSSLIAQPQIELRGSKQARPGYGAGLKLKIARNGVTGLMRFVCNIPKDCSVNELNVSSATISTSENEMRAVWLSVPLRDTIFQEWEMKIPEDAKGKYTISGHLEYFKDGVKKSVPCNSIEIHLSPFFTRYLED
jgi:hypothetical protein